MAKTTGLAARHVPWRPPAPGTAVISRVAEDQGMGLARTSISMGSYIHGDHTCGAAAHRAVHFANLAGPVDLTGPGCTTKSGC